MLPTSRRFLMRRSSCSPAGAGMGGRRGGEGGRLFAAINQRGRLAVRGGVPHAISLCDLSGRRKGKTRWTDGLGAGTGLGFLDAAAFRGGSQEGGTEAGMGSVWKKEAHGVQPVGFRRPYFF